MNKDTVRKIYLKKRQEFSMTEFDDVSSYLIHNTIELMSDLQPQCIHCFLPMHSKGEINTLPIIEYCWNNAIDVVVPVTNFKDKTLKNAEFKPDTQTKITSLNITEPMNPVWKSNNIIDLVITPLLAFDMKGFRVGYGGGFYDRFFASLGMNINRVGISLFDPCEYIDDMSELDIPLTHCVTPRRIYSF